jgi:hypothetical protein
VDPKVIGCGSGYVSTVGNVGRCGVAVFSPLRTALWRSSRTHAVVFINLPRALHLLDNANRVVCYVVLFSNLRKRTFANPNWRLLNRNQCRDFAQVLTYENHTNTGVMSRRVCFDRKKTLVQGAKANKAIAKAAR